MKKISSIAAGTLTGMILTVALIVGCSTKSRVSFGLTDESGGNSSREGREESHAKYSDNSLLGRWSFDDADLGRNTADGRLNAKIDKRVKVVAGVVGKAVELSPRKATVIEVPPDILPENGLSELTFSAWIAPATLRLSARIIRVP